MANTTFTNIPIGRKFKTQSKVTYKKITTVYSVPINDATDKSITNGKQTAMFYKTNVLLELV